MALVSVAHVLELTSCPLVTSGLPVFAVSGSCTICEPVSLVVKEFLGIKVSQGIGGVCLGLSCRLEGRCVLLWGSS